VEDEERAAAAVVVWWLLPPLLLLQPLLECEQRGDEARLVEAAKEEEADEGLQPEDGLVCMCTYLLR
jgi:hypothetical protein